MNRRGQVLEVALELFAQKGVQGTSMRDLARRANLSVAAAYHHFESKQALLQALFDEQFDNARWLTPDEMKLATVELRRLSVAQALASIIEGSLERLDASAAFVILVHTEVLHDDADAVAVGRRMWAQWSNILRALIEGAGIGTGEVAKSLADTVQLLVWGSFLSPSHGATSIGRNREAARLAATLANGPGNQATAGATLA